MITKTYDRKRGTWIYDRDGFRVIVYKYQDRWRLRAGPLRAPLIAPEPEVVKDFRQRHHANSYAYQYLGEE